MSKFVDVYLLPIKEENLPAYKKLATAAGRVFIRNGAIRYREYVAADLNNDLCVPFPKRIKLVDGETIIYAAVEFKSEAHRNRVMKKLHKDPELAAVMPEKLPFDPKRMVYGGFSVLVDL